MPACFKADIQDPSQKLSSWNEDDDSPCNWIGVKCNPRLNRVTELNLDGFSLSSRIGRGLFCSSSAMAASIEGGGVVGTFSVEFPSFVSVDVAEDLRKLHRFFSLGLVCGIEIGVVGFSGATEEI